MSKNAQKLHFRFQKDYESVRKDLDNLGRTPIQVKPGMNCPFEAILIQVYTPPGYTATMLRRQACCFMAEFVHVFFPLMKNYLKKRKIGFTTYLEKMFTGEIWCDEYILGAIAKMWQIRITVVSPLYSPPWDIFHDGCAHMVLVANGGEFSESRGVTHFSSLKGKASSWRCVQPPQRIAEIARYYGCMTGSITAVQAYAATGKRIAIEKATQITEELDDICETVKLLMEKKDKLIETMDDLNFEVDHVKYRQKYVVVSSVEYVRPKLAAVRRIQEDTNTSKNKETVESDKAANVVVTADDMEGLMEEFVYPEVHRKIIRTKAEKKMHPEGHLEPSQKDIEQSQPKKRKKDKHHSKDMTIKKLVMKMNEKEQEKQKVLREEKRKSQEEQPLPTLGDYENIIESNTVSMEPGVVTVKDIVLPTEESSVQENENIEELQEYTNTFQVEVDAKDIENVDKYLVQENVITSQPRSAQTDIRQMMNLQNYYDVNPNAPDNTPVMYKNLPFNKGSVDFFERLTKDSKSTDSTRKTMVHPTTERKDTGIHKMKSTGIKLGTGLQIFNPNKPDDNSETTGQFQEVIDADDLQEVPSDDLDIYLPQSENVSAKKTHVQTDIVKVHRNEQQSKHLPSDM